MHNRRCSWSRYHHVRHRRPSGRNLRESPHGWRRGDREAWRRRGEREAGRRRRARERAGEPRRRRRALGGREQICRCRTIERVHKPRRRRRRAHERARHPHRLGKGSRLRRKKRRIGVEALRQAGSHGSNQERRLQPASPLDSRADIKDSELYMEQPDLCL
jgi:hypothetical protein